MDFVSRLFPSCARYFHSSSFLEPTGRPICEIRISSSYFGTHPFLARRAHVEDFMIGAS